uniref:Uncharacterized protein n=1 Tax=Erpetoichthys calabaricus TaxID=27687 RepID=A0A8C4RCN6_ERPCA
MIKLCTRYYHYEKRFLTLYIKLWKEKFLYLSLDGNLLICRDADSPPDLEIGLHSSCEAILEGTEISDLPRLPLGAQKDCCLALTLRDGKYLLLLASDRQESELPIQPTSTHSNQFCLFLYSALY